MNKRWELVVNVSFVMFLCLFVVLPIRGTADSYLEDSGKMEIKVDRVGQTDEEKKNVEKQKTELDKRSIDLFIPKTENEIQKKKAEEKEELDTLHASLFLNEQKMNDMEHTLESLFHSNYATDKVSNETNHSDAGGAASTMLTGLLIAIVVLICIGIYTILRKSWR